MEREFEATGEREETYVKEFGLLAFGKWGIIEWF